MSELRSRYTVYIVDDDVSVRDSLALILSLQGFRTASFARAEDFLAVLQPDWSGCVVADLKMPGMSGLDLQQELARRAPALPVVIITAHGDVASSRLAFRADAVDFLEKPFDDEQIIAAIDQAFARLHDKEASRAEAERRAAAVATLTAREREVMLLLGAGMQNRDAAARLGLSPRTVEVHKARILAKLGIRNVAELVRLADATLKT
jgi:RNA polymerase sigma factor (sigma-70 family)